VRRFNRDQLIGVLSTSLLGGGDQCNTQCDVFLAA
jgi:hypothetical protein